MRISRRREGPSSRRGVTRARLLHEERGSFLVEALVAAVILVIMSLGFLAALDSSAKISGTNKSRAAAASLAQDDIERLRALKIRDLATLDQTRTSALNGVNYTIKSKTTWVDDATGAATCPSAGATKTDYLKLTSTVTWPAMGVNKPVVNQTLVAIPLGTFDGTTGGLIVRVQNRNTDGIPGIHANLSGTSSSSGVTDSDGCIYWASLAEGGYWVDIAEAGYVDPQGVNAIHKSATVTSGATNALAIDYDRAATIRAQFGGLKASAFMVGNSHLTVGSKAFTSPSPATEISSGPTLFPFTDGYVVWAGSCTSARPSLYGGTDTLVTPGPGGSLIASLTLPPMNIVVQKNVAGVPTGFPGARVKITPSDIACSASAVTGSGLLDSTGKLINKGFPWGDYAVCVDDGTRRAQGTVQLRSATGNSPLTLNIPTSGSGSLGIC